MVRDALRREAARQAPRVLLGFGAAFALLGLLNLSLQPRPQGLWLGGVNVATGIGFLGLGARARRAGWPVAHADVPVALVALVGASSTALGLVLFDTPARVVLLILVVIGTGLLTYSRPVLLAAIAASAAAFLLAFSLHGMSSAFATLGVALVAGAGIAIVTQGVRASAATRLEAFRVALARRNAELQQALEATRASEQRFRSVVEHVGDLVSMLAPDGTILYENDARRRALGYAPGDRGGSANFDLIHPDDLPLVQEEFRRVIAKPAESGSVAYRYRHADGSWRHLETRGTNLLDVPGVHAIVCISRDVTERIRLEDEASQQRDALARAERLASLGTLVAGVAHEINNPLMYMLGNAELVQDALDALAEDERLDPDARAGAAAAARQERTVLRGISRLADITKGLKRAAKAADGQRAPEDVNVLCQDVLALVASRFDGRLRVATDFRANRPVFANATELTQVVLNLVVNACESMQDLAEGVITVRTADERTHVVIEVEDEGPGIPPEQQAKLFTPLHTTKPAGTGLGLAVSYRIVEGHGGRVCFRTSPLGTIFRIDLPALVDAQAAPRAA